MHHDTGFSQSRRHLLSRIVIAVGVSLASAVHPGRGNDTVLPSTGAGSSYANACNDAWHSYMSATASYIKVHGQAVTQTQTFGGPYTSYLTYYANASTLCDGLARLTQSPAISISTGVTTGSAPITAISTAVYTQWYGSAGPSPSCSIAPRDCDNLWLAYNSPPGRGNLSHAYRPYMAKTTARLDKRPYCANSSNLLDQASIRSWMTACGPCTIFGQDVQLVYFPVPTTVSRDMCASEPKASLTHYADDAIIEVFAGIDYRGKALNKSNAPTAVIGQHTFTSGTAYISIASVWAEDRCGRKQGVVRDAILAMPSSSILSLRYSQNHFQYFMLTDKQTGYPVSYADFNTPIPWSAWNGQAICRGPYAGYPCSVIYEDQYRPQLAIPPGIRQLNTDWATCQMWYGGLYDPPMALQPQTTVEQPTRPAWDTRLPMKTNSGPRTTSNAQDDPVLTRPAVPGPSRTGMAMETGLLLSPSATLATETHVVRISTTIATTRTLRQDGADVLRVETEVEVVTRTVAGSEGADVDVDGSDILRSGPSYARIQTIGEEGAALDPSSSIRSGPSTTTSTTKSLFLSDPARVDSSGASARFGAARRVIILYLIGVLCSLLMTVI